jgi:hypothetical protein
MSILHLLFHLTTRERKHLPMIVRGFLARDKEGSSVAYSVVRKLGPDTVSRQKDRTGAVNVFVRGYNFYVAHPMPDIQLNNVPVSYSIICPT